MTHSDAQQKTAPRALFVIWIAYSRRSQLIADKLLIKMCPIQSLKRHYIFAPVRYVLQAVRTFALLVRQRPRLVFVQNPPIFAAMVVYLYAKLWKAKYIIDSHTGALLAPWWKWSLPIHAFLSRRAITTIVTNKHLQALVESWGADVFILSDIPTEFPSGKPFPLNGKFNIAVINSFSPDEPLEATLEAAASVPETHFYITGDPLRAKKSLLMNQPANVTFTGFLSDEEYIGLLRSAHAVMTLTTDDHTMQRGACEAIYLGKPIITSDWPILQEYFDKGTLHVDNSAQDIREATLRMQQDWPKLEQEILLLQQERWQEWEHKRAELEKLMAT